MLRSLDAASYDQQSYLAHHANPTFNRARANSDNSHPTHNVELGPLARIPSPDPDHIDGLSRHPSHSSQHAPAKPSASFLPTLPFESSGGFGTDSPKNLDSGRSSPNPPEKAIFNHPSFNSSAPTLSTMVSSNPLTLTHRSATAPAKRLVFANNLSVYDTFSSSVYDRRSEPATWSRLTPALAQRIKEELNSYKMEEMEVHAASRIQWEFKLSALYLCTDVPASLQHTILRLIIFLFASSQLSVFPKTTISPYPSPRALFPFIQHKVSLARTDHISNGHQSPFTPETYTLRSRVIYRAI
jgi:hypothetical protein